MDIIDRTLSLPRRAKNLIAAIVDTACLTFALWFSLSIREEAFFFTTDPAFYVAGGLTVVFSLVMFRQLGLYRAVVRYVGARALGAVATGVLLSTVMLYGSSRILEFQVPVSSTVTYCLLSLLLIGGSRLLLRASIQYRSDQHKERVIIYGAGASGRQLAQALFNANEFHPVAFIDDDNTLQGSNMLGLTVYPSTDLETVIRERRARRILLAIPSASKSERKAILENLEPLSVQVQTIPGMADLVAGTMRIDQLEEVRVEDLLGRDPVPPRTRLMDRNIRGKVVMVTGAGGSIGSELCRQIIQYHPRTLVLFEVSEYGMYAIEQELRETIEASDFNIELIPMIGTVQRRNRLTAIMESFQVQTVYHAAAYKHVPMMEYNIVEAVRNNVFGTWHTAEAAVAAGVESFVLISTDKAVRPTNVMGATKRMAELVLQAMARRQQSTCLCMVRFGNVLGSSGSVVPRFRAQIEAGGPVTVTDPNITRYFMTIPEASQLVIQAGAMSCTGTPEQGSGGDVFVLDMGEPVKIDHLARKLIRLMGKSVQDAQNPHGDIAITYSGLRPGEKLYEELLIGDKVRETDHPRIMTAQEIDLPWQEVATLLDNLDKYCRLYAIDQVHALLREAPLAFSPTSEELSDLLWSARQETEIGEVHSSNNAGNQQAQVN